MRGTGSEDCLDQARGVQQNAVPVCGSSTYEGRKPARLGTGRAAAASRRINNHVPRAPPPTGTPARGGGGRSVPAGPGVGVAGLAAAVGDRGRVHHSAHRAPPARWPRPGLQRGGASGGQHQRPVGWPARGGGRGRAPFLSGIASIGVDRGGLGTAVLGARPLGRHRGSGATRRSRRGSGPAAAHRRFRRGRARPVLGLRHVRPRDGTHLRLAGSLRPGRGATFRQEWRRSGQGRRGRRRSWWGSGPS